MRLNGRTVLITGGVSGIGLALAAAFLGRGSTVVAVGRSEERLAAARAAHPGLLTRACDVSSTEGLRELVDWMTRTHPGFDVLVNNAGVMMSWNALAEGVSLDRCRLGTPAAPLPAEVSPT
jgi:uncharacterized oxidoreductase